MKQQGNFLLLERDEFRDWLKKQSVARKITHLQVHHTAAPNYTTRKLVNGVAKQDHFTCLEGMRSFHLRQGWSGTGQNITTFEDGKIAISLDRNLNKTPAGIRGANTGMICIENIGNFDKGGDVLTSEQRKTIIHLYACLAEKFNIPIDTNHIVYHAWYTASGTRLNDYTPGKSSKTCPGTNFWGDGNTIGAANKNFIPQIKAELARIKNPAPSPNQTKKDNKKEDDEPMTAEEKATFIELQRLIKDQAKRIEELENLHKMNVPDWAKEAVEALSKMKDEKGKPVIDTPNGRSADFYSLTTVNYRAGLYK